MRLKGLAVRGLLISASLLCASVASADKVRIYNDSSQPITGEIFSRDNGTIVSGLASAVGVASGCLGVSGDGELARCTSGTILPGAFLSYDSPSPLACRVGTVWTTLGRSARVGPANQGAHNTSAVASLVDTGNMDHAIGAGWDMFSHLFGGDNGDVYGIRASDGALVWYRNVAEKGNAKEMWGPGGQVIGTGWTAAFGNRVFGGYQGVIYGIKSNGDLIRYQNPFTGKTMASGKKIGGGWDMFKFVTGGYQGVIYAIKPSGEVFRYKNLADSGTAAQIWEGGGGKQLSTGEKIPERGCALNLMPNCLDRAVAVFSGDGGRIYALQIDGRLAGFLGSETALNMAWHSGTKRDRFQLFVPIREKLFGVLK